ncbi:MAG: hypothetical protein IJE54_01770 [Peptococcaceae bacterium]|nr:hypothetical protein [Peptococcaceae bacterium]
MFDWNGNGEHDVFDDAITMALVDDELNRSRKSENDLDLDLDLADVGYDRLDLELMDDITRDEILSEAGLDPDDYDF